MSVWNFIENKLQHDFDVMLLFVAESIGSSPGKAGFAMAVANDDSFSGTIGGGIMEYKLVEKAKNLLQQNHETIFLQEQYHDKIHAKNQSGMICSGSQKIIFVPLSKKDFTTIQSINNQTKKSFSITTKSFQANDFELTEWEFIDENNWQYTQNIIQQNVIHIIGGGHCGLALSELMSFLGFYIHIYDDRKDLNTVEQNYYAHEKHLINYENINNFLNASAKDYVVLMTIGYRTDKIILSQIIKNSYYYLGLLGSEKKINTLFTELKQEGVNDDLLNKIHTPIGININSQTTQEIAVSIAAEIIKIKNT
ncbi:MAG: XdhC family protein [Bacteroidetes bacterium]|mgnify:CR=1 FL=1|nr:XdhC family protein [Bacteroidota bacterium]MBS1590578.1 XdhC family protein [Bacteroidota bacterium]